MRFAGFAHVGSWFSLVFSVQKGRKELEIMGQALLALSVRASAERLSSLGQKADSAWTHGQTDFKSRLRGHETPPEPGFRGKKRGLKAAAPGFRVYLQVTQREAVRKASLLGPEAAARLACHLAAAARDWPSLLRPWRLGRNIEMNARLHN